MFFHFGQRILKHGSHLRRWIVGEQDLLIRSMRCSAAFAFFDDPFREGARGFDPLHIVHGDEGCNGVSVRWRRVQTTSRMVHRRHPCRQHRHAFPVGVHASPVERVSFLLLVNQRVAAADADLFPMFCGW